MTDRERLIELIRNAPRKDVVYGNVKLDKPAQTVQTIADYLLENGVIVPPCKVGQAVYIIDEPDFEDDYVLEVQVSGVGRDIGGVWVTMDLPLGFKRSGYIGATDIGKTVFLTKEEAEQALKEREQNDLQNM